MSQLTTPRQCAWSIKVSKHPGRIVLESLVHHLPDAEFLRGEGVTADMVMTFHEAMLDDPPYPPGVDEYLDMVYQELTALEAVAA